MNAPRSTPELSPICVTLARNDDFEGWREEARALLILACPPERVSWAAPGQTGNLFSEDRRETRRAPGGERPAPVVSRAFLSLASRACLHVDPHRFALLYRLLWRLQDAPKLMDDHADDDVRDVERLARDVRRDMHKMRAFVRFRSIEIAGEGENFVAWFEPAHHILRANSAFFVNRFSNMRWSILTPQGALHWDGQSLLEGPPAMRSDAPTADPTEDLWHDYYAATFNPARLKIDAMLKEMPRKYWKNMPETRLIPGLIAGARAREIDMVEGGRDLYDDATLPENLEEIASAIGTCRRCSIGCNGSRAVMGEGPASATFMIVGEQPGDVEELEGRPFVGPAGRLLTTHLETAGIDRTRAYVTNAVKHFKFTPQGKRRIHETPSAREIDMCRWWVDNEKRIIRPKMILALGASAARSILGKTVSVQKERGRAIMLSNDEELWVTVHPSYLLRLPDEAKGAAQAAFADDLQVVAQRLAAIG